MRRVLLSAACAVLVAGCTSPLDAIPRAHDDLWLLTFTLMDQTGEHREANPGPHCGTAWVDDDRARLERDAIRGFDAGRPWLLVDGALDGPWVSMGSEGYPLQVPAEVPTGIPDEATPVAHVSAAAEAGSWRPYVDGRPVTLPASWTTLDPEGEWHVEARLEHGPDRYITWRMENCM